MDTWCSHKRHLVISSSQFYPDDHFLGISYVNPVSSFVPPVRTKQHRLSIPKLINCNLWNHWNGFKTSFSSMFHTVIRPQRRPVALNTVNPLQGGKIRPSLTATRGKLGQTFSFTTDRCMLDYNSMFLSVWRGRCDHVVIGNAFPFHTL